MNKTAVARSLAIFPVALINFTICISHSPYAMAQERNNIFRLSSVHICAHFFLVNIDKVLRVDFVKVDLVWFQLRNNLKCGTFICEKD